MGVQHETVTGAIELFPAPIPATPITDELARILTMLSEVSPRDATISFDFDGKLHVHFDVRRREDVAVVEAILPTLDVATSTASAAVQRRIAPSSTASLLW